MYLHECVCGGEEGTDGSAVGRGSWNPAAESRKATLGYGARSTSTSMLTPSRLKGGSMTPSARRTVAMEGAARSSGGGPHDEPPEENQVRKVWIISAPPRPFGSGHCDHALLYRYPLSLGTPNTRKCEPRDKGAQWTCKRLVEGTVGG
jgi:hypothetical protein